MSRNSVNKELLEFLLERHGGQEQATSDFRKNELKKLFHTRLSRDVAMREIIAAVETRDWMEWFGTLSIVDFLNIFNKYNQPTVSVATAMAMERSRAMQAIETSRNSIPDTYPNSKDQVEKILQEFNTTPWLTKDDLKRITGIRSTSTIDKLTCAMCQRRLISDAVVASSSLPGTTKSRRRHSTSSIAPSRPAAFAPAGDQAMRPGDAGGTMKARCPNDPSHNKFVTTAHVMEEWCVDAEGHWLGTIRCLQVDHEPDPDNTWTCAECDAMAKVTR